MLVLTVYIVVENVEYEVYDRYLGTFGSREKAQAYCSLISINQPSDWSCRIIEDTVNGRLN